MSVFSLKIYEILNKNASLPLTVNVVKQTSKTADFGGTIERLGEAYAKELPTKLDEIANIWQQFVALQDNGNDASQLKVDSRQKLIRSCHSLAGSAGTFGYPELTDQARTIETQLKSMTEPVQTAEIVAISESIQSLTTVHANPQTAELATELEFGKVAKDGLLHENPRLIYIVENDTKLLDEVTSQLESYSYQVKAFKSLTALETSITAHPPAVLILDERFMSATTRNMLESVANKTHCQFDLITLTAKHDLNTRLEAVRMGAKHFFTRPVDVIKLIDKIDIITTTAPPVPFRVLIIDDSKSTAEFYGFALQQAGMQVKIETHSKDILNTITEFKPEVILLDLYMPECSGLELAQIIRQDETYIDTPIVYLSGESSDEIIYAAMAVGADAFLSKPIKTEHLISSVTTRVKRYRNLKKYIHNDSLTGILNHTSLMNALESEIKRSGRHKTELCYAMLDLDNFKNINDSYGHQTGDVILKSIARLLKKRFRLSDHVGRYGGEEFAIVLPDTSLEQAHSIIEKLRTTISKIAFQCNEQEFNVSASFGVADYRHFPSAKEMIDAADTALYKAKTSGRNMTVLANKTGNN